MQPTQDNNGLSRRSFLRHGATGAALVGAGGLLGLLGGRNHAAAATTVWQIDPLKCIACDKCSTECVLAPSAVKCVHAFAMCGYCRLCTGFFEPDATTLDEGAENQLCPVNAIRRTYVQDPYYEYRIDEKLCVGCGRCVKGCGMFGNGSLFMQIRHDRCVNCNDCSIARACPTQAISRVSIREPYILKDVEVNRPGGAGDAPAPADKPAADRDTRDRR
jgi:Na+-translocating ferredoxin:NAD+ oxidoreductase subunit B